MDLHKIIFFLPLGHEFQIDYLLRRLLLRRILRLRVTGLIGF
jgi:hypothetical protein